MSSDLRRSKESPEFNTLVVVFRKKLALALSPVESTTRLQLKDTIYEDRVGHRCNGFYDWLRNDNGIVLGVRYDVAEVQYLAAALRNFSYVGIANGIDIEIYFSDDRRIDSRLSHDQDFVESRILQSDNGEYAVAFSTHLLEVTDIERLRHLEVDWEIALWT